MTQFLAIRSKENVRNSGEVFTPFPIVDEMIALIPAEAWQDPTYCFLEPACGNGQFLVRIFEKRIASGISIEDAVNTMIGMDITYQNIIDCHFRLYERVCYQMQIEGIVPQGKEWWARSIHIIAVVMNNVFRVEDSIAYIKSGKLANKKFFFIDPTGNNQVSSKQTQKEKLEKIKKQIIKLKKSGKLSIFAPFFRKDHEFARN